MKPTINVALPLIVLCLLEPLRVAAQEVDEIVVVTARMRDEALMGVPVSVSVVDLEALDKFSTSDIRDLQSFLPEIQIERQGSGAGGTIAMRGISTSSTQAGFEQAVSLAIDGIQTGRPRVLSMALLDVQQIEVLKGPQALFFGKNSPGGVVSIKTANPTREFEGIVRSNYDFEANDFRIESAVSGALSDAWAARLAVSYRDSDGIIENTATVPFTADTFPFAGPDLGVPPLGPQSFGEDEVQGRLSLAFRPEGSRFSAQLKLAASDFDGPGSAVGQGCFVGNSDGGLSVFGVPDPYAECVLDNRYSTGALTDAVGASLPGTRAEFFSSVDVNLMSATMDYSWNSWSLRSVTGLIDIDQHSFDTFEGTSFAAIPATENEQYRTVSQEIVLTSDLSERLDFLAGLYYEDAELQFGNNAKVAPFGPDPISGILHTWEKIGITDGRTRSIFTQVLWDISDSWELSVGARYTNEDKASFLRHTNVHAFALAALGAAPVDERFDDNFSDENVSPQVTLTWRPRSDLVTFVGYRTGFKSGGMALSSTLLGYDPANKSAFIDALTFDSEEIGGVEAGFRAQLSSRPISVAASIYSYDYEDLQVSAFDAETTSFSINNAASARVEGLEVQFDYVTSMNVGISGSVNYNDATYEEFVTACSALQIPGDYPCDISTGAGFAQSLAGTKLTLAPELAGRIGVDWESRAFGSWRLLVNVNVRYSDDYVAIDNGDPRGVQDSYTATDASLRFTHADSGFELALIGRNVSNQWFTHRIADKPGQTNGELTAGPGRLRQVVLEAAWRF